MKASYELLKSQEMSLHSREKLIGLFTTASFLGRYGDFRAFGDTVSKIMKDMRLFHQTAADPGASPDLEVLYKMLTQNSEIRDVSEADLLMETWQVVLYELKFITAVSEDPKTVEEINKQKPKV
jgi:hypothetical protein